MILSDSEILKEISRQRIVIAPYNRDCLGSNSYDIHLSKYLATYQDGELDAKADNEVHHFEIPPEGYVLVPNTLYLGSTLEYTETHGFVPYCEGKSSTGRLGMAVHITAGKGDAGFCGHWTLEITVQQKLRVYAGMPIGQLTFFELKGDVINPYNKKETAKYNNRDPRPKPSMMFKNKF